MTTPRRCRPSRTTRSGWTRRASIWSTHDAAQGGVRIKTNRVGKDEEFAQPDPARATLVPRHEALLLLELLCQLGLQDAGALALDNQQLDHFGVALFDVQHERPPLAQSLLFASRSSRKTSTASKPIALAIARYSTISTRRCPLS